jgi:hypothetical protein
VYKVVIRHGGEVDQITFYCAALNVVESNGTFSVERVADSTTFGPYGGTGGTEDTAECQGQKIMTAVIARAGDRIDSLSFFCCDIGLILKQ